MTRIAPQWLGAMLGGMLGAAATAGAYAEAPFPVLLPVGQERRIDVPGAREVRVGVPQDLRAHVRVESAGEHVWLTARRALAPRRLYLQTDAGARILEVRTDAHAPKTPLRVPLNSEPPAEEASAVGYVALARFAVQALYAPEHARHGIAGIRAVPVARQPVALFRCRPAHPSACGDAVEAIPHAAWELPPHYVTAVAVRNRLPQPLRLDPRDIRGRFAASAIVHPRLEAAGSPRDATTVVLISRTPFGQVQ